MADSISNSEGYIDVRDVIARVEEIGTELEDLSAQSSIGGEGEVSGVEGVDLTDEAQERANLTALLDELRGNGGDHEWNGAWYPVTLIRDSSFQDYAQEHAEDIGAIGRDAQWPLSYIDWDRAADELKMDYQQVDFDGVQYWYR
jgi:hypothetical protein